MAEISVKLYDWQGKEIGQEKLAQAVFGVAINPQVVRDLVIAQQKNARTAIAHTKGRSEVRGGGRKPWQQKGTGRARHGSIRSPLWIGGGVTFGPTSKRNFTVKINKKLKDKVLRMIFTDKVADHKLVLVESYNLPEAKTKLLERALNKLPGKGKSILIITKNAEENIVRAAKNLPRVATIHRGSLNVLDLLKHEYLLINKEILKKITENYS